MSEGLDRHPTVRALFEAALQREPEARAAYVTAVCGSDEALREQVAVLLRAHDQAGSFLENPLLPPPQIETSPEVSKPDGSVESVPAKMGHYRITGWLGSGGMGVVYAAYDDQLDRAVAIKVIRRPGAADQSQERLRREARAAASVNHPHVCQIYEVGVEDGELFIAMELLEGESLATRLRRGPLPFEETVQLTLEILDALEALHRRGVIHRDLKPANVFLTPLGVKLLDFGLARLEPRESGRELPSLTGSGTVIGTPGYMAPEQLLGQPADARTDLFAAGGLLFEMLTGEPPLGGSTVLDLRHTQTSGVPAHLRGPAPLAAVNHVLQRALARRPEDRYESADAMAYEVRAIRDAAGRRTVGALFTSGRRAVGRHPAVWSGTALALVFAGVAALYLLPGRPRAIDSLAILPFVNVGGDPNTEYLSDGITETLIYNLSQVPSLKVVAFSSLERYKRQTPSPQAVATTLGVRAVVLGRVVQRDERLSISVELVDTADNRLLWGNQYSRAFSDVLVIQDEISREIAEKLRLRLGREGGPRVAKRHPADTEAYQLYVKGRYFWNRRTEKALKEALGYFGQAISRDPEYALAYAGVADSYATLGNWGLLAPKEAFPKAKEAAGQALALDPELAEAHTVSALVSYLFDWDSRSAESGFRTAIRLNPNYAPAHQWYALYLVGQRRVEEAATEIRRAQELDPLSLIIHSVAGAIFYYARQYDKSIDQELKTIEMDHTYYVAHWYLGRTYLQKGMYKEAIAACDQAVRLSDGNVRTVLELARAYAQAGRRGEAEPLLADVERRADRSYVASYDLALTYTALDDANRAFGLLRRAYEERYPWLVLLNVEPKFDRLRNDPRFAELVRRVGLK